MIQYLTLNTFLIKNVPTRLILKTSFVVSAVLGITWPLQAQLMLPEIRDTGVVRTVEGTPVVLPNTPTHVLFAIRRFNAEITQYITAYTPSVPLDSLRHKIKAFAALRSPRSSQIGDLQLQPLGLIEMFAERDQLAEQLFAQWRAKPGISSQDRASALAVQIAANNDPIRPDRMQLAEMLLDTLRAMGNAYSDLCFELHQSLMDSYYQIGHRDKVMKHGEYMLKLALTQDGYNKRGDLLRRIPLVKLVQAYAGASDGVTRIGQIIERYRAGFQSKSGERALVSEIKWYNDRMQERIAQLNLVGHPAPALVAHAWLNTQNSAWVPEPRSLDLADGKIRVLEFGTKNCGVCMKALPGMERIYQSFRSQPVEVMFVTATEGCWGTSIMDAPSEVQKLKEYFVDERKLTLPIAVWAGQRIPNDEGGSEPQPSPNNSAFKTIGTPTIIIVDGKGRIRNIRGYGSDNREGEEEIYREIKFLLMEEQGNT